MHEDRMRRRIVAGGVVLLVAMVVGILVWHPASDGPDGPETNALFDEDGDLAEAMPALSGDIGVEPNDDGSSQVTFSVTYDVTHPGKADPPATIDDGKVTAPPTTKAKPDQGVITVQVSESMGPGGPIRLSPMTKETQFDRALTETETTHDYSFRLNPKTTEFLNGKGLGSKAADTRASALQYIDIDVQHLRDFKVVDGEYDWQQGRAYTAKDKPVQGATITDDSTLTVNNDTAEGVFGPTFAAAAASKGQYDYDTWNTVLDTADHGVPLTLAGQAVECIDQGDGSNPQGFAMLNGWDLEDDLPPGMLPTGASVTQQINADDGLGTSSLSIAQDYTTADLQVLASALGTTTPGLKSGVATAVQLGFDIAEFSDPITLALAVPIKAILQLVDGIYDAMTNSCASFANVFNLTVAEPTGAGTSISWGDQTNGLDLTYSSASYKGSPVTNNVSTVASNALLSTDMPGAATPYAYNPYLEQAATVSCGDSNGAGSGGGCDGQSSGNNVIDVRWSTQPMCPFSPASQCTPNADQISELPQVTIPGTDLCGTGNLLCTPYPAPNSDAQGATLDDLEGAGYEVVYESNPDHAVSAIATNDAGDAWYGDDAGSVWSLDDQGNPTLLTTSTNGAVTGMYADGDTLLWSAGDDINVWDTSLGLGAPGAFNLLTTPTGTDIEHLQWDGNTTFYAASETDLYAWTEGASNMVTIDTSEWDVGSDQIESMWANGTYLFVGFQGGWIYRCDVADCGAGWTQVHDAGFDSAVQAMTSIGDDTLYAGLGNGAVAQIDQDDLSVTMIQGALDQGGQVAGLANVQGNLFIGGCLSNQSPVSGDWLGLEVFTGFDSQGGTQFNPELMYNSCQNPSSTTSQLKGFSDANYALTSSPATATHPPLVYVAQSISSQNYFYVLESTNPPSTSTCIASTSECPAPPATPAPAPPVGPTAVGSLGAVGPPVIDSTCSTADTSGWFTSASSDAPLTTAAGESVTDGFQLTPPVGSNGCTTTYAWNLNNSGSYLYEAWQANAYPAAKTGPADVGVAQNWNNGLPVDVNGAPVTTGAQQDPDLGDSGNGTGNGAEATEAPVPTTGSQIEVELTGSGTDPTSEATIQGSAPSLVLSVYTDSSAEAGATSLVFTNDTLTSTGQALPAAVPLYEPPAPPPAPTTTTTAAESTSTSSASTTTTTTAGTTTTTQPPACVVPEVTAGSNASAVWPLDDRSATALDVSGNGNSATIANAAQYDLAPGPLAACTGNGGLVFNGSSTSVTAPAAVTATGGAGTFAAFVNIPASAPSGVATVLANDAPATSGDGVALGITTDDGEIAQVSFDLGLSSGELSVAETTTLAAGQWHLLVGVYDGAAGTATLYADGAAIGSTSATGSSPTLQAGAEPVTLGIDPTSSDDALTGQLADVAVLAQALTAPQIAAMWAAVGA